MKDKKSLKTDSYDNRWQFWIDRGGTFTDVVARQPDGRLITYKLLSENPEQYQDAAMEGVRRLLGDDRVSAENVAAIKMGTTVATNALLERKGDRTLLVTTQGFADALRIAYQNRPRLFDLDIKLPKLLHEEVVEIEERIDAQGNVLIELNEEQASIEMRAAYGRGMKSVAILLMHGYRYSRHELLLKQIAEEIGFSQISVSHEVSPLMKLVGRGDTTVLDAYLSPVLRRYVDQVADETTDVQLMFMQSNGGLTDAHNFHGKDAILSGPAGGVVGMVRTAERVGLKQLIGFDMGGTSTDVSHYNGEFERTLEKELSGIRIRAPMMHIHTVAAGGGSVRHRRSVERLVHATAGNPAVGDRRHVRLLAGVHGDCHGGGEAIPRSGLSRNAPLAIREQACSHRGLRSRCGSELARE